MLPILFTIGPIKIYTFGVFLVLAFFWGAYLLWKLIRLTAFKEEEVFDGLFWSFFGALVFGRFAYIILNLKEFGLNLAKYFLINGYPGLSLYGVLFGGFLVLYFYSFFKKIRFEDLVDYFIPPLFTAIGFGKLGSFFSGAEAGLKTKFILAIRYSGFDGLRHLTPLYESLMFFLAVVITYKIIFEIRKEKFRRGFNYYFFIWYFSGTYFLFDKIKVSSLYLLGHSFNKVAAAILLLTTTIYFLYYFRSLVFSKIKTIINLGIIYGQKSIKKIHFRKKRETEEGKGADTPTNS